MSSPSTNITSVLKETRLFPPPEAFAKSAHISAAERDPASSEDTSLGWGAYVTGPVEVVTVPGNHYTMFREPHVHVLAEQLRRCLNAVGKENA